MTPTFRIRLDPHPGPGPARGVAHVTVDNGPVLVVLMLERGHRIEAVTPTVRCTSASYRSYDVPYWEPMRNEVERLWREQVGGVS